MEIKKKIIIKKYDIDSDETYLEHSKLSLHWHQKVCIGEGEHEFEKLDQNKDWQLQ